MNSDRTQKVMVILLAGMAIGISSFAHSAKPGRADFSSYDDDEGSEVVARVQTDVEINKLTTQMNRQDQAAVADTTLVDEDQQTVVVKNAKIDGTLWTADVEATITSKSGKITATYSIPVNANSEATFKRRVKEASDRAIKVADEKYNREKDRYAAKKEKEERIANCEEKSNGKKIDDSKVDEKLKCFSEKSARLSGDKKKAYLEEVVAAYMKKQQGEAYKQLASNNPTAMATARATLVQLQNSLVGSRLNLGTAFNNEMQMGILTANARLAPFQARATQDWLTSQHMMRMASNPNMPPAMRAQMEQQYHQQMNAASAQQFTTTVTARTNLVALMNSNPSRDPNLSAAANATVASLQNDIRYQIATNSNLQKYSGMINPAYGTSSSNLLANDPYGTNAIFNNPVAGSSLASTSSLFSTNGINTFDNNQFWNPNVNNMATLPVNDPTISPAFQPPALTNSQVAARRTSTARR